MQSLEVNRTLLRIDGSWQLEELSDATRYYLRIYGFAYSLLPGLPTDQNRKSASNAACPDESRSPQTASSHGEARLTPKLRRSLVESVGQGTRILDVY